MASIICGKCKQTHRSVEAVKGCYRYHNRLMFNARQAPPVPTAPQVPQVLQPAAQAKSDYRWPYPAPLAMVKNIREGRYAVEINEPGRPTDWVFVRVLKPTKGKRAGQINFTTQHSETYSPWMTFFPGSYDTPYHWKESDKLGKALFIICTDPVTSAINYGRELGRCSRCGKELTDERSRWYSIGPECEKHWTEIINVVNETKGVFIP